MTDYMDLALKYGGFTSLDKVYLKNTLSDLSDSQKLAFITPPPRFTKNNLLKQRRITTWTFQKS